MHSNFFHDQAGAAGTGLGLGLAQVLSMCEQTGDASRIESVTGSGRTVSIYLPQTRSEETTPMTPEKMQPASSGLSVIAVLLLEDDIQVQVAAGVSALLELPGCTVIHESCADTALWRLRSGDRFSVTLSDIQMPGELNGRAPAEGILRRWPDFRIALMTGYAEEMTRARGLGILMFGKPFNVEEFKAFIFNTSRSLQGQGIK